MFRARLTALALAVVVGGYLAGGSGGISLAVFTDQESDPSTFTTAATFPDLTPPVVSSGVISKTTPYVPGFVRQGGSYYVYANVTDAGSGVATVTADVSTITTGMTAVALVAGSYSIGGVPYSYRSASITANAVLAAGAKAYTVSAVDAASNSVTQGGFSVTVDNTGPAASAISTTNASGGIAGRPEPGDTITFTFTEQVDPQSILAGWTGASTAVVVRITQAGGGDTLTVRNAGNSAQLPLGSVNLGGTNYVTTTRDFGASGAASTMTQAGASISIVLGTPSGATTTQATNTTMAWTPAAAATDRAGNACTTTVLNEAAPADIEF
jgi:hypothetical protein